MLRCAACLIALTTLGAAELQREKQMVGSDAVTVSNKSEITISARNDADVKNRELWYGRHDGSSWGAWQKHGLNFARDTKITWAPPEGHWRIFVRIEEVSGLMMAAPEAATQPRGQFIIDRTPPSVAITFPAEGSELRGGHSYDVTWTAEDAYLHSTPVTIKYSRSGDDNFMVIAENIPNSGSYSWTTPQDMTATGKLQIVAADKALNLGSASVGSLVVDAIAPSRNVLGPAISASREVAVSVRATDAGPAGLAKIQLYYSIDAGSTWSPGPEVSAAPFESIPFTAPADGVFLLDVVATDEAGNANPLPSGKGPTAFSMLVDTEQPVISLASANGVRAVGGVEDGRRVYKPGDKVEVAFTIKDATVGKEGVTVLWQPQTDARWETLGTGLAPDAPFAFAIPDIATTTAMVKVMAVDAAGNTGEVSAEQPIAIDNKVEGGAVDIDL